MAQNLTKDKIDSYYELLNDDKNLSEWLKCKESYLYFIKTYYTIINLDRGQEIFKPFSFQEELLDVMHNNRKSIFAIARQSGKTTTVGAYLLWVGLFHNDKTIAVVANKQDMSKEILKRIKLAYDYLPEFLKVPLAVNNVLKIEFLNGSVIEAFSTSSDGLRGRSINLLYLDEYAFVPYHVAKDFEKSVMPTVSSSKTSKIIITSTPKGLNHFYRKFVEAQQKKNDFAWKLYDWKCVPSRDQSWAEKEKAGMDNPKGFEQEYECIVGTSLIKIKNKYTGEIKELTMEELFDLCEGNVYDNK